MVGALKKWLGIDVLGRENFRLAKAMLALEKRLCELEDDFEVRIAFCESQLTAKTSSPKIVAKAHKRTFRQFAEAASQATEEETAE